MVRGLMLVAGAALLAACSALLSVPNSQCARADDCAQRGFAGAACTDGMCVVADAGATADAADPIWGCIGDVKWPLQDDTRHVRTVGQFLGLLSNAPIADIDLRVCSAFDVACTAPLANSKTDADGRFELSVSYGFRGFVDVRPPESSGLLPMLMPYVPPPFEDEVAGENLPIHDPSNAQLDSLLGVVGKSVDPEAGHVFAATLDCRGQPAGGVVLETTNTKATSVRYYVDSSGLPNTDQPATTSNGSVGYVNLPPGPVALRWTLEGRPVGTITVQVRKGVVTVVALPPTPLTGGTNP